MGFRCQDIIMKSGHIEEGISYESTLGWPHKDVLKPQLLHSTAVNPGCGIAID